MQFEIGQMLPSKSEEKLFSLILLVRQLKSAIMTVSKDHVCVKSGKSETT